MSAIGYFKKVNENSFSGEILSLNLSAKGVRILKQDNTEKDRPSHRVYIGRVEVGAGWTKMSEAGEEYISFKLDDPSFTAPIYANLVVDPDSEDYTLLWSRPRK